MAMNRPSCAELVEAVREYLEHKVQPSLNGALAYENRVAINALKILEREAQAAASLTRERERLRRLLGRDGEVERLNAELCERIVRGDFDKQPRELFDHLHESTLDKLAVDNPHYAAYERALERRARTGRCTHDQ